MEISLVEQIDKNNIPTEKEIFELIGNDANKLGALYNYLQRQ
mgnify:CR=1 FL=1